MVTINSSFIGNFKLGDNICFNLDLLKTLYDYRAVGNAKQKSHLRKPIILLNVGIIEAVLYDFHHRVRTFTSEGVANLSATVVAYIQGKKIDELERYIASAKSTIFSIKETQIFMMLSMIFASCEIGCTSRTQSAILKQTTNWPSTMRD
jgi:hypothetical protein